MTTRLRQFWNERSARERQLLAVMLALFALLIIVFGIVRPLSRATIAARARLDRVTLEGGQITAALDTLGDAKREVTTPLNMALPVAVSQSAGAAGFTLATLEGRGPDRVGIAIPSAKSPALFTWLRTLAQQGVFVERLTVRTNPDATLAVEGTLRARKL